MPQNQKMELVKNKHRSSTMMDLLEYRSRIHPDRVSFTFLLDEEQTEINLTYGELNRLARQIGVMLQGKCAKGERALLIYPPGLDFITALFGCFYAGIIAIPIVPPRPYRSLEALQNIATDSQAVIALTTTSLRERIVNTCAEHSQLKSIDWVTTDSMKSNGEIEWVRPFIEPDALALLQYTSGSTGAPKGVMVSHENIFHNQHFIKKAFGQTHQSIIVSWLPHYHDMGLIGAIIQPIFVGARSILMAPTAFLQRPLRWLHVISRCYATTSGAPNFAYDLCVRRIADDEISSLNLQNWRVAFNGAEPVRAESLEKFTATFAHAGFKKEALTPCYGLAEATLLVTASSAKGLPRFLEHSVDAKRQRRSAQKRPQGKEFDPSTNGKNQILVSCGKVHSSAEVIIVDPHKRIRCKSGEIGEIWIRGASVAQGYWGHRLETIETFFARLSENNDGPYLRTGDLGFIANGELYISGRYKDVIILRGRNYYPQDIELTVEQCSDGLRPGGGAAFSFNDSGVERLAIVQEIERSYASRSSSVIDKIRSAIADAYEIEVAEIVLVKVGGVPKTTSGKARRHLCRQQFQDQTLKEVITKWSLTQSQGDGISIDEGDALCEINVEMAPRVEVIEEWLRQEVARRFKVQADDIELNAPLTRYGVDSLAALELGHELERRLNVALPLAIWISSPGIRSLATEARRIKQSSTFVDQHVENGRQPQIFEYPLSYGQLALWYAQQISTESSTHNLACAMRISSPLDIVAFRRTVGELVERHPALRTSTTLRRGEPVQIVTLSGDIDLIEEDASNWSETTLKEKLNVEAYRPFKLERRTPLRIRLYKLSAQKHILLLAAHHIIADFWSLTTIIKEMGALYAERTAPGERRLQPLQSRYADYVSWERGLVESEEGRKHWEYWSEELGGELPVLNLPTDRPRPPVQTSRGKSENFCFSPELTAQLRKLSQERNTTLFLTMLSAFLILLHRNTSQDDILLSAPTSGRKYAEWSGLVGFFVNPIVIRARRSWNSPFNEFLEEISKCGRAAFEHQDYPFSLLLERLPGKRDLSQVSATQAMIVMQKTPWGADPNITALALNETGVKVDLGGLTVETVALERQAAQFDFTMMIAERDGELKGALKYRSDLFDPSTIKRVLNQYQVLVESIVDNPGKQVSQLPLLNEVEWRQVLLEWNQTRVESTQEATIHQIFDRQAELTPDSIAVVDEQIQLTFAKLCSRASQLSLQLLSLGVGPETCVGVYLNRSIEMLVAVIGIMKSGGAYAPLDPSHPRDRAIYMLRDSGANVLVTQKSLADNLSEFIDHIICLDSELIPPIQTLKANAALPAVPENLAYVYYTSGSMGNPKGIMIQQKSVLNLAVALQKAIYSQRCESALRIGMNSPLTFDSSVKQLIMLLRGDAIHIIPEDVRKNGESLLAYIQRMGLDVIDCTPSHLEILIRAGLLQKPQGRSVMYLIGGEPIGEQLWRQLAEMTESTYFNLYGPTECTVDASASKIDLYSIKPVVGRPLANTQIYLLDVGLQPVPIGVPGELHISGFGLARGYINMPELTGEKFIPNPYRDEPGDRLYKTGDLASYHADGNVEIIGRIGRQVKIRGFRIELGEIETAIRNCEFVKDVAVVVDDHEIRRKRLVAYIVPESDQTVSISKIQHSLKKLLPDYMTPSAYVTINQMPLTSNGKVNYAVLSTLDEVRSPLEGSGYVAPRTVIEEQLTGMWEQTLGLTGIGVFDNFFEMGGHSLMATQLISPLQDAFPTEVPLLSLFFENPTISGLANALEEYQDESDGPGDILQALSHIRMLIDEESELMKLNI